MAAEAKLKDILSLAAKIGASDIHLKTFSAPVFRINGQLVKVDEFGPLKPEQIDVIVTEALDDEHRAQFKENSEVDLAYSLAGVGRFRMNVFRQRGSIGLVFRIIPFSVKPLDELLLPNILKKISLQKRGLILVTGTTGSGKSTTLAAIIEHINANRTCHIVTIEDPIEFLLRDKKSIVNQREVGLDTKTFTRALRSALRQDPDVIMVGEMRDLETISLAMEASMTGHLVFGTLHTMNAMKTVDRVVEIFPANQQGQVRSTLADALRAVVSQTLFKRVDIKGRVAALEILICTPAVRNLVREGKTYQIPSIMQTGKKFGMQTLDDAIFELLEKKKISAEDAYINCYEKGRFVKFLRHQPSDFTEI